MKKVYISFVVPENHEELESLVGKPVGVSLMHNWPYKTVYRGIVYDLILNFKSSEPVVEFLKQIYTTDRDHYDNIEDVKYVPTNLIEFIRVRKNDLKILADFLLIPGESRWRRATCYLGEEEYDERLNLLQINEGMWEKPVKFNLECIK